MTSPGGRLTIAILATVSVVLAGCGGAATPAPSWPAGAIVVTARNRTFDTIELHFQSGVLTQLVLVNDDTDTHDIEIWTKEGFAGDRLSHSDVISRGSAVVPVGPLAAGTYYFVCAVHPQMHGTVIVE